MDASRRPIRLPFDTWRVIIRFLDDVSSLCACNKELLDACYREAQVNVFERYRLAESALGSEALRLRRAVQVTRAWTLPPVKSSAIPLIRIALDGGIRAHLVMTMDGQVSDLNARLHHQEANSANYVFAVISEHCIETTLSLGDSFRGALLRRCGIYAFETGETSDALMKRIEVRWRGVFNSRLRLFGIPLIIYVPRIVDRRYVHEEVYKRVVPFLKNPASAANPPYTLTAYNISAHGVANELAFTADYMVLDSSMHAMGEQFCLVLDFGMYAREAVCFDLFGDANPGLPCKSAKLVSNLVDRDCGIRML